MWYINRSAKGGCVLLLSIWVTGLTRSGKTTHLVKEFQYWVKKRLSIPKKISQNSQQNQQLASTILVFAANDDNRRDLAEKLSNTVQTSYPVICKTPLGFISDEVMLFWPLLFERLNLKAQFPLRLRPETEQELATRLWRSHLNPDHLKQTGMSEYRLVRRILDLLQLAGASAIEPEDIPNILEQGLPGEETLEISGQKLGELLLYWRKWCLDRGLLSYGIIYELYWRYLLPDVSYQQHLIRRYQAIFADDVDDYPAIARDLFEFLLDQNAFGVFTYNPHGKIRLGLNADPNYLLGLASRCQLKSLSLPSGLAADLEESVVQLVSEPTFIRNLPDSIQSIQTTSRAELLRKTAEIIIQAVNKGEVKPEEIAIIAPGLDEIARYTFIEILSSQRIPIEPLNEQRPLISSPLIRAFLTLLGLVYPGLGRLVEKDAVAEMLVVLSRKIKGFIGSVGGDGDTETRRWGDGKNSSLVPDIDPVRAGLLADYCYHIDLEQPRLLPVASFPRWDRLGHRATNAYQEILAWIEEAKSLQKQQKFANPIIFLDQAIRKFVGNGSYLPYDQLAALRELMETSQHYWEVERRLRQHEPISQTQTAALAQFIQLLRRGTITANPRPISYLGKKQGAITLATIFQYRSLRPFHRWQFWLDTASNLWDKGGAATLFAAPLFLKEWSGRTIMPEDEFEADQERLERIVRDLLGRAGEQLYLCYSELGVNGTEQMGPLLTLVHASGEI